MTARTFSPGFRLSTLDAIVLLAGTAAMLATASVDPRSALVVAVPLAHFFLFCNVFRIARPFELGWALAFVALAGATIAWDVPGWWPTLLAVTCLAVLAIALEMRKPSYHGIGWRRINPQLPAWWDAHVSRGEHTERPETTTA